MRGRSLHVEFAPGEFPVLLGYATLAISACVPETDQMPTVAWMVVGLLVIELVSRTPSALTVQLVAAGIVLWSGLFGAAGRGSAIVGAWFAFWPLVLVVGSALAFDIQPPRARWLVGAIGGIAALAVARTGGLEPTTVPAVIAVAITAPASILVSWATVWFSSRPDARASRH